MPNTIASSKPFARAARVAALFAGLALALVSCSRPGARTSSDEAASALPETTAVRTAPVTPELDALESTLGALDTLAARAADEITPLVIASDSVYVGGADPEAAKLRWAQWGEPWNAKLASLERGLPAESASGASHALRYANRSVRMVIYELRLIPSADPEQPVPLRADAQKHLENARRALVETRQLIARARIEGAGV